MKTRINPPTKDRSDSAYQAECEFALEPSVTTLIDEAVAAGWTLRHVVYAVILIATQRFNGINEEGRTDRFHS